MLKIGARWESADRYEATLPARSVGQCQTESYRARVQVYFNILPWRLALQPFGPPRYRRSLCKVPDPWPLSIGAKPSAPLCSIPSIVSRIVLYCVLGASTSERPHERWNNSEIKGTLRDGTFLPRLISISICARHFTAFLSFRSSGACDARNRLGYRFPLAQLFDEIVSFLSSVFICMITLQRVLWNFRQRYLRFLKRAYTPHLSISVTSRCPAFFWRFLEMNNVSGFSRSDK